MDRIDDGGPIYPRTDWNGAVTFSGISLRDWMAAQFAKVMLSETQLYRDDFPGNLTIAVSKMAYAQADAMLVARRELRND